MTQISLFDEVLVDPVTWGAWLDFPGTEWAAGAHVEGYLTRGALFSSDRVHRYVYVRTWDAQRPLFVVVALNPSTADENAPDPTVARLEVRARALGHGGLVVLNLFAYRSTEPRGLRTCSDPVGPANDAVLERVAGAGFVLCAWGTHGTLLGRAEHVLELLRHRDLHALRLTKGGHPEHPLYLPYQLTPFLWRARREVRRSDAG